MTTALEQLRKKIPARCAATQCNDSGCNLTLECLPQGKLLIDLDCDALPICKNATRCDFLLFAYLKSKPNDLCVAPIELKKGKLIVSEVARQLQAGAKYAEQILNKKDRATLCPVAGHGGKFHKHERANLRKQKSKIQFKGAFFTITIIRCGKPLRSALPAKGKTRTSH